MMVDLRIAEYQIELLHLVAEYDVREELYWNTDLEFYMVYSDVFGWAIADTETISSQEDVELFRKSLQDCKELLFCGEEWGSMLYACRKRKMRPQGAMYKLIKPELHSLFDAVGPVRETDFLNPVKHPHE